MTIIRDINREDGSHSHITMEVIENNVKIIFDVKNNVNPNHSEYLIPIDAFGLEEDDRIEDAVRYEIDHSHFGFAKTFEKYKTI